MESTIVAWLDADELCLLLTGINERPALTPFLSELIQDALIDAGLFCSELRALTPAGIALLTPVVQ